jgi:hypothetical protein
MENMYQKIWLDDIIYEESTCLILHDDHCLYGRLVYDIEEIISIKDCSLQKELPLEEFSFMGHVIYTKNDKFPHLTTDNLIGEQLSDDLSTYQGKKYPIVFTEGSGIFERLIFVTYKKKGLWKSKFPLKKISYLPKLSFTLANSQNFKLCCFGDSIMTGCNASSKFGLPPYQDDFPLAFKKEVEKIHHLEITFSNPSVGGMLSSWGKENVDALVNSQNPDLVILNFGMNDGSWEIPTDQYILNMRSIIDQIKTHNPECEIIVISSLIPNPNSIQDKNQGLYLSGLMHLEKSYQGVVVLDMTTFSQYLLKNKIGVDLYANNINHPSDFLVRMFVSNLLTLIGD